MAQTTQQILRCAGLKQADLAEKFGICQSEISALMRGRAPSPQQACKIACGTCTRAVLDDGRFLFEQISGGAAQDGEAPATQMQAVRPNQTHETENKSAGGAGIAAGWAVERAGQAGEAPVA